METHNKLLYPLLVVAAIGVIMFSALGIATMMGYLPSVNSAEKTTAAQPAASAQPQRKNETAASSDQKLAAVCANCGVVESIHVVEHRGQGTGLGAVAGGLTGLLVGNQFGRSNGRAALTVLGGVGGAYAGNEIEKNAKKSTRFEIRVRLDNGDIRTVHSASSVIVAVGDKVRVENGTVVPQS